MQEKPWLKSYPESNDWNLEIPAKPAFEILDHAIEKFSHRKMIDFFGKKYSYAQINDLVNRAAKGYQDLGIKKGTRVAILLPNCPFFVINFYALLKIGAIVVSCNPLYANKELIHQLQDSSSEILISINLNALQQKTTMILQSTGVSKVIICDFLEALPFPKNIMFKAIKGNELSSIPYGRTYIKFNDIINNIGDFEAVDIDPSNDIALLQYTGGTTGLPKGAMLTHYNIYANCIQASHWFNSIEDGKVSSMGILPFFHSFALTSVMNVSIYKGMTIILHPRFEIEKILEDIDSKKPQIMCGVPALFNAINNYPNLSKYNLSSLKICVSGGAPLRKEIKDKFEELTKTKIIVGYGLTECSPIITVNSTEGDAREGSVGLPLPGTSIKIHDLNDKTRELDLGDRGEVCVEGPQVMKGYWQKNVETANTIIDDRLHTGDIGYIDADGYLYVVDRLKELIIVNGYNVYPSLVEEAIIAHPAVSEVAVVGVNDNDKGERIVAYIVQNKDQQLAANELKNWLKDKLAPFEMPSEFKFKEELPKTFIGKISKKDLKAEV